MIKKSVCAFTVLACFISPAYAQQNYATMAPVSSPPPVTVSPISAMQVDGITKTLMAYPAQTPSILQNYIGLDVSKIDFDQFADILARGDYNEIRHEIDTLVQNREAFNAGRFTDVRYYNMQQPDMAMAEQVSEPVAPVEEPTPLADEAVATTETSAAADSSLWSTIVGTPTGTTVSAGVVVAGLATAAALASGGKSGNGNDDVPATPPVTDYFGRSLLPDTNTPSSFETAEFLAYPENALKTQNVHYAFAKGLSGAGVTIGFHDFFTDDSSTDPQLSSRITYRNLNIAADTVFLSSDCAIYPTEESVCNHGGHVMDFAAAARDGTGPIGIAYNADLMMNSIFAGVGSVRTLADQGSDIINFSCTGCATLADLQYIANAGVLMTSAAGNTDFAPEPDAGSPAAYASQLDFSLIAVTGVYDYLGAPVNYKYNSCGAQKEYCMSAYADYGTSFAAPQIAGAAALIKEGWSYLTNREVSQILLNSAKDVGAPGVDAVFGHGILDMKAAMEPVGTVTVLSGFGQQSNFMPSSISQNQATPFGNAFSASGNAKGNVVAIDSYGRDFNVKTQNNLAVAYEDKFSADTLFALGRKQGQMKTINLNDGLSLKFNRQQKDLDSTDMVGYAEYDVAPAAKLKLGFATDMSDVAINETQKFNKNNFISQRSFENGYLNFSDNDQVFNQAIELIPAKNTKIKVSSYYSKNSDADYFKPIDNQVTSDFASSMVDASFAPSDRLNVNLRNGVTHEFDSVLGTKFTGSYEMEGGADTYFTGVDVSYDVAPNWNIFGSYTVGTTKATPSARSAFNQISDLTSDSFSVAATRSEILGKDSLSFAVGQPTRVRSGVAKGLTQNVDRTTGAVSATEFEQSLVPTGRNMQFQAAYQKELSHSVNMNIALEYETNPYQQAEADDEASGFMKLIYQLN